ncbi:MAG: adenosylcobinamide-phosphate synthase CbiB [Syntrophobacteraceae bacterium]
MAFSSWSLAAAYGLDLLLGDPQGWPHPIRWIGSLISVMERALHREGAGPAMQRAAGLLFWLAVVVVVAVATSLSIWAASFVSHFIGAAVSVWIGYTALATRSLHSESRKVADALAEGDLPKARERLSMIVSRETSGLEEKDIVRALVETVSENLSDGVVAPLLCLAVGGPVGAMVYKAINTMDSMVGYMSDRYRDFGWFAAKADDVVNWIPARLSGLAIIWAARLLQLDALEAQRVMIRDAGKMKSPNAGFPEAAAAGALRVQLGGANVYFGETVEKPTLGDPHRPLTLEIYREMVRLMYTASALSLVVALILQMILS